MDVEDMHAIDVAAIKNIADVMFIFFPFFIHMDMDVKNMHVINAAEIKNIAGEVLCYFFF